MLNPRRQLVFISYARRDADQLALRLSRDLESHGYDCWLDTARINGGASWTVEIEAAIDRCDVLLALLTPGSYDSDICRAEQLRALRRNKRVIPLLAAARSDRPLHLETANYRDFSAADRYEEALRQLVDDIASGHAGVVLRELFRPPSVTAPPLPGNYLARPEALEGLRNAVMKDGPGPSIALTALRGMGGIGKTVLAQALSQDEVIQEAFPDGVAWTTAGKEVSISLTVRMQEVRRALGDTPARDETELECIHRYRTLLQDKAALVIVDDVWRRADVEPYLATSRRSRILFTTRDSRIAAAVYAAEHPADLLTAEQALALLARSAGCAPEALPSESGELVRECGRLPLAVSMIGAMLRGKPRAYWSHVLATLRRADLDKIRAQFPHYPHTDLLRAIQVSVDALDGATRERYLALAVLLEDMPAAPAVQQTLWGVDQGDALETAEQFVSLSLAQRDDDSGGIRLHDLQLDYVRAQHPDRDALGLIHGAVGLASNVIAGDPSQFASQVIGRLLAHRDAPAVAQFCARIAAAAPGAWLRPLHPALHPPGTGLIRTLEGHSDSVWGVAVTPDGQLAVSASGDYTLKGWDLAGGRALRTLEGHSSPVRGVAVTPDGQRAVSSSSDGTLKVWDLASGRALRTLEGHYAHVWGVAVTPDGQRAVSSSSDGTLKVWDLASGRALRTLEGHYAHVWGVAVTPDGQRAVSASEGKTLKVCGVRTRRALRTLEGHYAHVWGVAVTPDGQRAVSASEDKTLKVWDLASGRELRTLKGHSDRVHGVAVTPDGQRAVSASEDKTLKVWDLESGRALRTLEAGKWPEKGHFNSVNGVAVTPDGQRAVSASSDKTLKMWDLAGGRALRMPEGHSSAVRGVAVTPDGRRAVSASWDHTLKVWDLATGRALCTLEGHSDSVNGVAVTPDGQRAVSASWDRTLKVWDLATGRALCTLEGHSDSVNGVAVTPDGQRAVSASWDRTLKVWDLASGRALRTLEGHSSAGVAVTPDGQLAVSAEDHTLKVWDLASGRELRTLKGHSYLVRSVAVTPDGQRAVSSSSDGTLKVWDLASGRALRTLEGHSSGSNAVAVTPDGQRAVSASDDKTLKVWDLASGRLLRTLKGHSDSVNRSEEHTSELQSLR